MTDWATVLRDHIVDEVLRRLEPRLADLTARPIYAPEPYVLGTREAAAYCGIAPQTLRNLLAAGCGPRRFKQGGRNAFRRPDLEIWVDSRLRTNEQRAARPSTSAVAK